jgi:hypothetical protein
MARSKSIGTVLIIVIFFGAFAAFGGIAVFIVAEGAYLGSASHAWPSAEGVIDESRIDTQRAKNDQKKQRLVIRYHYNIDGHSYRNDKAQFLDNVFYPNTSKQQVVARFPAGQTVRVYYNPSDPQTAVLITGFPMVTFIGGLLVGLLFLGIGVWGFVLLRK